MEALRDAQAIVDAVARDEISREIASGEWNLTEAGLELHIVYGGTGSLRRLIVALVNAHEAEVGVSLAGADEVTWHHLLARDPDALAQQLIELLSRFGVPPH